MDINKLKKVIQMVIPTARSALNYAVLTTDSGTPLTDEMVDLEANRLMKNWISIPEDIHPINQEFEENGDLWKKLLYADYVPPDSNIPTDLLQQVLNACKQKVHNPAATNELHDAIQQPFSFEEFNGARISLQKTKVMDHLVSPTTKLKAGVMQLREQSQFWQDRLMTFLLKINGVNDLSKMAYIFI